MATIPPWLDVTPQSFLGAREAGGRFGLARDQLLPRAEAGAQDDQSAAIAQENVANMFKAQELARQQQQDALAQQQYEAQVKLQADQLARKYQAQQQYKSRIAGGEDPLKVLMELGPEAGLGASAEAAAIRSMYQQHRPPPKQIQMPEVQFADLGGGQKVPYLIDKQTGRGTWMPSGYLPKTAKNAPLTEAQREAAIARLDTLREKMEQGAPNPKFIGLDQPEPSWNAATKAQFKSYKAGLDKIDAQIDRLTKGEESPVKVLSISEEGTAPQGEMPAHDDEE